MSASDQAARIERFIALVQPDLPQRLQSLQAAVAVILPARRRRVGQQDFQRSSSSIAEGVRQGRAEGRHESNNHQT